MTYAEDHAANPCGMCGSPPGVRCEHDDPLMLPVEPAPPERPIPAGWPDAFDPAAAEALIAATLDELGNAPGICELVGELRWAIAQLRAERATTGGAR